MLAQIRKKLTTITTRRNMWAFSLLALTIFGAINLFNAADGLARLVGYSGSEPMFKLDVTLNYNPDTAYAILTAYGDLGRRAYILTSLIFDFALPVAYSLALATCLNAIYQRLLPASSPWQLLSLLPFLAGGLDLLENIGIISMLASYPGRLDLFAGLTNIFTLGKFGFLSISLILLAVSALFFWWRSRAISKR